MRLERFTMIDSTSLRPAELLQELAIVDIDMLTGGVRDNGLLTGSIGYTPLSSPLIYSDGEKLAVHVADACCCAGCMEFDDKSFQPGGDRVYIDTIPGNTTTTATLTPGSFVGSDLDSPTDTDWFSITLTAGQSYTFYTIVSGGGLDTILTLYNSAGSLISQNDDANTSAGLYWSEIRYTATTSGTFFLGVSGYSGDTGSYYLTSSAPVSDTIAASSSTTAALTLGSSVTGEINANGDHDWYAVTLTAGTTYEFVTSAVNGTDVDTTLVLRNGTGAALGYNDDSSGTYSRLLFTASTSGTYYLDVGAWGNQESGAYQVRMAEPPPLTLWTLDQVADQLENGYWGGTGAARHFNVTPGGNITVNITALTADGQFLARAALDTWTDVLGITFTEVSTGGQITFDDTEEGAFATSSRSGNTIISSQVNVSTDWVAQYGTGLATYSFQTYIHEIGHAIGLGHAGNYNGSVSIPGDLLYLNDSWPVTVMSYVDQEESPYFQGLGFSRAYIMTPMGADIVAMQAMYGFATTVRTGDSTYGFNNNTGRAVYDATVGIIPEAYAIVDNGGIDTLDYSGYNAAQTINLNAETFSNVGGRTGNVSIGRGTIIENAIGGGGADTLIGNAAANILQGRGGVDTIGGGDGNDIIIGGAGADILTGGAGNDTFRYLVASEGPTSGTAESITDFTVGSDKIDLIALNVTSHTITNSGSVYTLNAVSAGGTVRIAVTTTGGALTAADILFTAPAGPINGTGAGETLNGTSGDDVINGLGGNDTLNGLAGNDTMDGGTGNDILVGGAGVDILTGGTGTDTFRYLAVSEAPNTGTTETITDFTPGSDKIDLTAIGVTSYTITNADSVYTLNAVTASGTLRLAVTTTAGALTASDILGLPAPSGPINGTNAAETLDGTSGDDVINGAGGNDILNGLAGDDILNGDGNNDTLNGGDGNDTLNGGIGTDNMVGGAGNDAYFVNLTTDTVTELANQGTDTVNSSVVWTLAQHFENLTLTGGAAINGTGNSVANIITGNLGANTLAGLGGDDTLTGGNGNDRMIGGAGADTMTGGLGNDTYQIVDALDTVIEAVGEGIDLVQAYLDYTLDANVENLYLYGSALVATGNALNNRIIGTTGANTLNGMDGNDFIYGGNGNDIITGGAGRDFLFGQTGADRFVFDDGDIMGSTSATADLIRDFSIAQGDTIDLSLMDAITGGADNAFAFIGTAAFTGTAGQLRFQTSASSTTVMGDMNGDGVADFWIVMNGVHALTASEFVL